MKPKILLLDEPFGALDEATREDLQDLLLSLYQENLQAKAKGGLPPYTILIVTHELNEALYVGDRVVGLSQYWNWKDAGHSNCPGARVIYDKAVPVFLPGQERDPEAFRRYRDEIRAVVFETDELVDPKKHRTFWNQIKENPQGILA